MIDIKFDSEGRIVSIDGARSVGIMYHGTFALYSLEVIELSPKLGKASWKFRGLAVKSADVYSWLSGDKVWVVRDVKMDDQGQLESDKQEEIE